MDEQFIVDLLNNAISGRDCDHMTVYVDSYDSSAIRFANSQPTQNQSSANVSVEVCAAYGQQVGRAVCNLLDKASINSTVLKAQKIAKVTPPNIEYIPPSSHALVTNSLLSNTPSTDDIKALLSAQVGSCLQTANETSSLAAGLAEHRGGTIYFASSGGQCVSQPYSYASCRCSLRSQFGSGYAEASANTPQEIDALTTAKLAAHDAEDLPVVDVEPGAYPLLMTPLAFQEFLNYVTYFMDSRAADEHRSCFSNKLKQPVASSYFSMFSRPTDNIVPRLLFDREGNSIKDVDWIRDGQLVNLSNDRYWASQSGREFVGRPSNIIIPGKERSLETMIGDIEYGLLASRFWYIRHVDAMKLSLTGMTRDGFFLIENGKITARVRHMRFNESPLNVLPCIRDIGKQQRVGNNWYIPPVTVDEFHFTSKTTF